MSQPGIEAIYPLTFMQQALLFHHLQEEQDQGLLHVSCTLTGKLDPVLFQKAWQATIDRHSALRTSIHWQEIEKPVQIVQEKSTMPWTFENWTDVPAGKHESKFEALKKESYTLGLDMSAAPVSRITLVQLDHDTHYLLWNCHHILLDGWSVTVILTDVFANYDAMCIGGAAQLEAIPSYPSYIDWIRKQDISIAQAYWQDAFKGFDIPMLICDGKRGNPTRPPSFKDIQFVLSEEVTSKLHNFSRIHHVTFSTLIQGLWGLLLNRYLNANDVTIGMTVSGRTGALPNMDLMAGLFANVVPVRASLNIELQYVEWLQGLQKSQIEAQDVMYATLDQINSWIGWQGGVPLFDSLLVIENFPWTGLKGGDITVNSFDGALTTTYPLTVVIKPGAEIKILLRYNTNRVSHKTVEWFSTNLIALAKMITTQSAVTLANLLDHLDNPGSSTQAYGKEQNLKHKSLARKKNWLHYVAPIDESELELTKIWEEVLGQHPISVTDNFFEIGGRSIQAVRLFGQIERRLKSNIPPTALIQYPTIRALAGLISGENNSDSWSSLVPLRASGDKPPIFCIHGGGAHVLFYQPLARYLGPDQPVYGLQPVGLDGIESTHTSIEEMAAYYVDIVRKVQPLGPYTLVSTCFGIAVTLEMGKILDQLGDSISTLVMVDSAPPKFLTLEKSFSPGRFMQAVGNRQWDKVSIKIRGVVEEIKYRATGAFANPHARNIEHMRAHLAKLYQEYTWKSYSSNIIFIRSTESVENPEYHYQDEIWSKLALGVLDVHIIPGHHRTIFEDPEVKGLARQLSTCLEVSYSDIA